MQRPRQHEPGAALLGDLARLHRQPECGLWVAGGMGDACEAIERFALADPVAVGTRRHLCLQGVLPRSYQVRVLLVGGALQ